MGAEVSTASYKDAQKITPEMYSHGSLLQAIHDGDYDRFTWIILTSIKNNDSVVNKTNFFGGHPLFAVLEKGRHWKYAKFLIEHGSDVDMTFQVTTVLTDAIDRHHHAVFYLLLDANVNVEYGQRYSPLTRSLNMQNSLATLALLHHGANPNGNDSELWTPLCVAIYRRNREMIKRLLIAGADPNLKPNNANVTPIRLAMNYSCRRMFQLLRKYGADPLTNADGTSIFDLFRRPFRVYFQTYVYVTRNWWTMDRHHMFAEVETRPTRHLKPQFLTRYKFILPPKPPPPYPPPLSSPYSFSEQVTSLMMIWEILQSRETHRDSGDVVGDDNDDTDDSPPFLFYEDLCHELWR